MEKCDLIKNLKFVKGKEARDNLVKDQDEDNESILSLISQELHSKDEFSLDDSQESDEESMPGLIPRNMETDDNNSCDKDSIEGITLDGYETDNQNESPKESNIVTNAKAIKSYKKETNKQSRNPGNV